MKVAVIIITVVILLDWLLGMRVTIDAILSEMMVMLIEKAGQVETIFGVINRQPYFFVSVGWGGTYR